MIQGPPVLQGQKGQQELREVLGLLVLKVLLEAKDQWEPRALLGLWEHRELVELLVPLVELVFKVRLELPGPRESRVRKDPKGPLGQWVDRVPRVPLGPLE